MTTYILCGGEDRHFDAFGVNLSNAITERVGDINLLDVYFAGDEKNDRDRYEEWGVWYRRYFPEIKRVLATRENFREQMRQANVIYVHGGRTETLLRALPNYSEIKELIKNKIYIGSSAGANYTGAYFMSQDNGVQRGSGILPINVAVHYDGNSWQSRSAEDADMLERDFPAERTLRIREGEFEVIEHE